MPNPYLAASLVTLRQRINTAWPERDHTSDGWIGDAAHQARVSDHNPDSRGCVHALDVDKDGLHVPTVLAGCIAAAGTNYVIHNRRIWQARDQFQPRTYTGANPHAGHIHESIFHTVAAEANTYDWSPLGGWPTTALLRLGTSGYSVRVLQAYLNAYGAVLAVDAQFGAATDKALRSYQARHGLTVDGICGPATRHSLAVS